MKGALADGLVRPATHLKAGNDCDVCLAENGAAKDPVGEETSVDTKHGGYVNGLGANSG